MEQRSRSTIRRIISMVWICMCMIAGKFSPTFAQIPTPPPQIDFSAGMVHPYTYGWFPQYTIQASWNPAPSVWYQGSGAPLKGSDLAPVVLVNLQFQYTGYMNVRFENTFNTRVVLRYKNGYYTSPYYELVLDAHTITDPFFMYASSPWSNLQLVVMQNSTSNYTAWTTTSSINLSPNTPPTGMKNYHSDFLLISLRKDRLYTLYRGERFTLYLADRRQHTQGTTFSPVIPSTDFQIVPCLGRGQIGLGYACFLNPLPLDPDRIDPATADPSDLSKLLWMYYVYDLRREDSWDWNIDSASTIPTKYMYDSVPSSTTAYSWTGSGLRTRIPITFLPVAGIVSLILSPYEATRMQPDEQQIPSDVCDPNADSTPDGGTSGSGPAQGDCVTLFLHSGLRVLGVFSTAVGDIHVCQMHTDSTGNIPLLSLGTVSVDGTYLDCFITAHIWSLVQGGSEITLTAIKWFPADRGYHTRAQEVTWEKMTADDLARREQEANGDQDHFREERKIQALSTRATKFKRATLGLQASIVGAATSTFATSSSETVDDAAAKSSHHPREPQFSRAQLEHVHIGHIQKLLSGEVSLSSDTKLDSLSSSNLSGTNTSSDPYAWQSSDFNLPPDGVQVLPNSLLRLFISHSEVSDDPMTYHAKKDSPVVYFITTNVAFATFCLVASCAGLTVGIMLCERCEDKCPAFTRANYTRVQRERRAMEQAAAEAAARDPNAPAPEPQAVRLIDVEPELEPALRSPLVFSPDALRPNPAPAAAPAPSDDAWVWRFDFTMEERIDRRSKKIKKQIAELEKKHAKKNAKQTKSKTSVSSSSAAASTSTSTSTSSSSNAKSSSKKTPIATTSNKQLAAPLLGSADVAESKEDIEAQEYQPPTIPTNPAVIVPIEESNSEYSAM